MTKNIKKNKTGKRIIIGIVLTALLLAITPIAFFISINDEWQTRKEIKNVRNDISINGSKDSLVSISESDRILDIIAVDKDGKVIYTIKGMSLFSDLGATVLYDSETGLIKFDGARKSYFQRNSILGSLLDIGDDDYDYDDDDDRIPSFDYRFVKDNMYQTIAINDSAGNVVYIVCTQDTHIGFVFYLVFTIVVWSLLMVYWFVLLGSIAYKRIRFVACPACQENVTRGNKHCTKCGASLLPKCCESCGAKVHKGDTACGKCGNKLDDKKAE